MKKLDPQSVVSQLLGGARGRLVETVATVGRLYSVRQLAERAGSITPTHPVISLPERLRLCGRSLVAIGDVVQLERLNAAVAR